MSDVAGDPQQPPARADVGEVTERLRLAEERLRLRRPPEPAPDLGGVLEALEHRLRAAEIALSAGAARPRTAIVPAGDAVIAELEERLRASTAERLSHQRAIERARKDLLAWMHARGEGVEESVGADPGAILGHATAAIERARHDAEQGDRCQAALALALDRALASGLPAPVAQPDRASDF